MNIKKFGFLLIVGITFFPTQMIAQRVFAPNEDGVMIEIKEGAIKGKYKGNKLVEYPRKMDNIVTFPLKFYFVSEENFDPKEWFISQTIASPAGDYYIRSVNGDEIHNWNKQEKFNKEHVNKIASNIYEISYEGEYFKSIDKQKIAANKIKWNGLAWEPILVIGYEPNKEHAKEGKTKKYWFANISQLEYDSHEISEWTKEQAIESVNQLMSEGKTTEQLFASIKPQQAIPQVVNGQQIQYVVIQNPPSNSPQENNQETKKDEKLEIISDVDKNIPYRDINNENTFALIIANEDYNKVGPVNFALRDGQKINEYLKKTLGIGKDHIAFLENATLNDMRYEINRLTKISDAYNGEASFIIYYIGHGIPDEKNGNGYLLPIDGYGNDVSTAYPLEELYSQLSGLDAKKIVLFTDACFSGAKRDGGLLMATRGITIKPNMKVPDGKLIVLSATAEDQTAFPIENQKHGLFTYTLLRKIQETNGDITWGELADYVTETVKTRSIDLAGKLQSPTVSVSPSIKDTWRNQKIR